MEHCPGHITGGSPQTANTKPMIDTPSLQALQSNNEKRAFRERFKAAVVVKGSATAVKVAEDEDDDGCFKA